MPVEADPADKPDGFLFKRQETERVGDLEDGERGHTYSDVQRKGFKENMLDLVKEESRKEGLSDELKNIMTLMTEYAKIDVTGDMINEGKKAVLERERQVLIQIMQKIQSRLTALGEPGENESAMDQDERILLNIYKDYLEMDTTGYLRAPDAATLGNRWHEHLDVDMKKGGKTIAMRPVPKEEPLFPHEPSVNDIAQGGLGDCYLLAALSAVVDTNPQLIKECMKDNGDGTVTVRLYDKEEGQTDFLPHYIRVRKRIPKVWGRDPFAAGSLWVQLMEQAYVISKLHKPEESDDSYDNIIGGQAERFVERITGREQHMEEITTAPHREMKKFQESMMEHLQGAREFSDTFAEHWKQRLGVNTALAEEAEAFSKSWAEFGATFMEEMAPVNIVEEAEEYFRNLTYEEYRVQELKKVKADLQNVKKETVKMESEIKKAQKLCAHENMMAAMNELLDLQTKGGTAEKLKKAEKKFQLIIETQSELPGMISKKEFFQQRQDVLGKKAEKLEAMRKNGWIEITDPSGPDEIDLMIRYEKNHFEGMKEFYTNHAEILKVHRAFSGIYSDYANQVYDQIREAQEQQKTMTAATVQTFISEKRGAGKNAEGMESGLASNHAYTLLGVRERNGIKYVKLRNPWAVGTRAYTRDEHGEITRRREDDGTHGIFLIELNEFLSHYDRFSIG